MPSCTINPIKINVVNRGTAIACNDYREPEDCKRQMNDEPRPRRALVRLLVVLAVAAMTVWAVVYIANSNKKGSVQVKKVKGEPLKVAKDNFPPLPPGSIIKAGPQLTPNLTCPCDTIPATYSWCKFINFSLIVCNKETNYKPEVTWISSTTDSCTRLQNLDPLCQYFNKTLQTACINAVNTALDFILSSQTPHIQTPVLSTSLDVHDRVALQMQANIHTHNQTMQYNSNKTSQDIAHHKNFGIEASHMGGICTQK
ncbi:hypothetical protein GOP47_0003919 [Adiantum capillus-veneris]|uniref:Uncharacterized protein n=1 Tax=Adiantum capillus-veneris TaxID=13818 RepID=A0A9D4V7L8_ADICA|nr:hypothetical protein GOP47_0003919 [Adiantum capillus-veneris]